MPGGHRPGPIQGNGQPDAGEARLLIGKHQHQGGQLVLIGDAAHAMLPTLGRGACEALVDAVTLADLLNTLHEDQALRAYDRQRRRRTCALSAASAALGRVALAEGAQPLRDRLLTLTRWRHPGAAVTSGSGT